MNVALYTDSGAAERYEEKALIKSGIKYMKIGPDDVAAGTLEDYDVFIIPGAFPLKAHGKGGFREFFRFFDRVGGKLLPHILKFVENGGGLIAVCASVGIFGKSIKFPYIPVSLGIKPVSTFSYRGVFGKKVGIINVEKSKNLPPHREKIARRILGTYYDEEFFTSLYFRGPIMTYKEETDDEFIVAVYSDTEPKNMAGKGAIAYRKYGKGKMLMCSIHPEFNAFDIFDYFIEFTGNPDSAYENEEYENKKVGIQQKPKHNEQIEVK